MEKITKQGFEELSEENIPSVITSTTDPKSKFFEKHLHENYYIILEVDSKNKHILTLQRRFISSGSNEKIIEIP